METVRADVDAPHRAPNEYIMSVSACGYVQKNQRFPLRVNLYPLRGPKTRSLQVRDTRGLLHRDAKRNIVNHRATPASLPI